MARTRLTSVLLCLALHTTVSSGGDFFGEELQEEFGKVERSDKINRKLERGFKNFEERCLENGGEKVLDEYLEEQEQLVWCVMEHFDLETIQNEIEKKKKSGDLDEVFRKYCGDEVPAVRECLASFFSVSEQCLTERDRPGLNISLAMVDSAIEFTCHNQGDRIALFMAEEGVECVAEQQADILRCINNSLPHIFSGRRRVSRMHFYVFQQENCRKGDAIIQCVEQSLMKCADPTPSNLVHGLLRAMRDTTPCAAAAQSWQNAGPATTPALIALTLLASANFSLL